MVSGRAGAPTGAAEPGECSRLVCNAGNSPLKPHLATGRSVVGDMKPGRGEGASAATRPQHRTVSEETASDPPAKGRSLAESPLCAGRIGCLLEIIKQETFQH